MSDPPRAQSPLAAPSGSADADEALGNGMVADEHERASADAATEKPAAAANAVNGAAADSDSGAEPPPSADGDEASGDSSAPPEPETVNGGRASGDDGAIDDASQDDASQDDEPDRPLLDSEPPTVEASPTAGGVTLGEAVGGEGVTGSAVGAADAERPSDEPGPISEPAGPIEVTFFGRTDVGQIREHNEDNLLVADLATRVRGVAGSAKTTTLAPAGLLLVACDGMGGAAAGEVASQLATDVIYDHMLARAGHHQRERLAMDVIEALELAGARILAEATDNRAYRGMGTTATVAALVDDHLLLGQVGDSRGYVLRGDRLVQVTRDQSLVNQLVEAGQLTAEEAENFEHSNIILQALGTAEAVQVDLTYVHLRRGDVLLLCSDGLSGMIRDSEIAETLTNVPELVEACRVLIDDANEAGGHDNITVVMALFAGEGLKEPTLDDVESLKYAKYAVSPSVASARSASPQVALFGASDEYDSTPSIEITGEFEIDPNTNWHEVLDERAEIPKQSGPAMSSMLTWVLIIAVVLALYFLLFAR